MDFPASPQTPSRPALALIERLTILDGIIIHARQELNQTVELIERLQEHCVHIKGKLSEAEREQAALLTEAERL